MTNEQLHEGICYAENTFKGLKSPSNLDKKIFAENFNFDGHKILDFGCGMGGMTLWYAQNWDCEVMGIDSDSNQIEVAKNLQRKYYFDNVRFEARNVLENPLREKFDFIILNDVAAYISLDRLEEILYLLKKNLYPFGKILLNYTPWESPNASHLYPYITLPWCQFLPNFVIKNMLKKYPKSLAQTYDELNHLTYKKLNEILKNLGLETIVRRSYSKLNEIERLANSRFNKSIFKYLVIKELVVISAK